MAFFLRPSGPRALWKDISLFWRTRPRGQWIAGALAVTVTSTIVLAFFFDSAMSPKPRETITFVDSWPADRSDEQIRAKQKADLARREAAEAANRRRLQEIDQSLNRLGI